MKSRNVIGYVNTNYLSKLTNEDILCLDIVNIAFGSICKGVVYWDYEKNLQHMERGRRINPDIKFVLSIGGWGADGFSDVASNHESREKFAESAALLVQKSNLDGIDIDWEYPCIGLAGIKADKADKENFTYLLKALREALDRNKDRHYLLMIAVGGDSYYIRCTEMDKAVHYLDFVQLMTYDLRGGYSIVTGHHTNLMTNQADLHSVSTDHAVKEFIKAGVPREKLVIGAAFYSRKWEGVPNINHGLMQMTASTGGYGPDYGELVERYINKNGYQRFWDDEAKAPYLFNGSTFISYDDPDSIAWKADYVKKQGLAGIMYWEYQCDTTGTLTKWIADKLE